MRKAMPKWGGFQVKWSLVGNQSHQHLGKRNGEEGMRCTKALWIAVGLECLRKDTR
jgi:hypothetical protein